MPGLDRTVIPLLNPELALGRIRRNIRGDFVFSPHIDIVYHHAGTELWEALRTSLASGVFEPSLPIYVSVPKQSGLTRPGSILTPLDRLLYQLLVDFIAPIVEKALDRSRVYSHELLSSDEEFHMFKYIGESYEGFLKQIGEHCGKFTWAVRTDVASYFETLHHHPLINSLHSIGCPPEYVNLLEKLLLSWREKNSYGILQQCLPSDLLGNFYLHSLDHHLSIQGVPSVRFVDDVYMFADSREDALSTLATVCDSLRGEGLLLNESKTEVLLAKDLIRQETELESLLNEIRSQIEGVEMIETPYGFQIPWGTGRRADVPEIDGSRGHIEELFERREEAEWQHDRIIKFCLPLLGRLRSEIAIDSSLRGIITEPHLARLHCSYLATFIGDNEKIRDLMIEYVLKGMFVYEWQYMWTYATLLYAEGLPQSFVDSVLKQFTQQRLSESLAAVCAILVGYSGNAAQKRGLKQTYSDYTSEYIRGALLFCAQFLPPDERRACYGAWGGHTTLNRLILSALKNKVSGELENVTTDN